MQALNDKAAAHPGLHDAARARRAAKALSAELGTDELLVLHPGGPESMVEVKARTPVKYTLEPVVIEGRFAVLADDPYGLYYRVSDAVGVK